MTLLKPQHLQENDQEDLQAHRSQQSPVSRSRAGPLRRAMRAAYELGARCSPRARGLLYRWMLGFPFDRAGKHLRISGMDAIRIGAGFSAGDGCWIEAIQSYRGQRYRPQLIIGAGVSLSHWTHISCAARIVLGDGCLVGSKVYIGDHRHGLYAKDRARGLPSADRGEAYPGELPLADLADIEIGSGTWVGDGAVILGGSRIAAGSIVGANAVVRLSEPRPALIAGVPARVRGYLDKEPWLDKAPRDEGLEP